MVKTHLSHYHLLHNARKTGILVLTYKYIHVVIHKFGQYISWNILPEEYLRGCSKLLLFLWRCYKIAQENWSNKSCAFSSLWHGQLTPLSLSHCLHMYGWKHVTAFLLKKSFTNPENQGETFLCSLHDNFKYAPQSDYSDFLTGHHFSILEFFCHLLLISRSDFYMEHYVVLLSLLPLLDFSDLCSFILKSGIFLGT